LRFKHEGDTLPLAQSFEQSAAAGTPAECLTYCYLRSLVMGYLYTITGLQGVLDAPATTTPPAASTSAAAQALPLNSLLYLTAVGARSAVCS